MSAVADTCQSVLLIDDRSLDNFVSKKIIEKFEFARKIEAETCGQRALDLLQNLEFHLIPELILLDINMPRMNGMQFIEAFKQLTCQIQQQCKIVVQSASFYSPEINQVTRENCVLGFVSKPLSLDNLKLIKELLSVH